MSATINIIETTTELGLEVVEVVVASASTPGPAGAGVPTGGTLNQVLTKDSGTDYDTSWQDPQGASGGAPDDADYLVGTAHGDLSGEIVVGTSPGGELGGTWASPTVDATHSGSSHAAVQAAAEATAAAALGAHLSDTADAHDASAISADSTTLVGTGTDVQAVLEELDNGIADHLADATAAHAGTAISVDSTNLSGTSITVQGSLEELDNLLDDHSARHENGGADEISIAGLDGTPTELTNHLNDAADAHDASAISVVSTTLSGTGTDVQAVFEELDNLLDDHSARHENGGADEISIAGLDGTPTELTNHLNDATAAHAASAIAFTPQGTIAATDVQAAIQEVRDEAGGASTTPDNESLIIHMEVFA